MSGGYRKLVTPGYALGVMIFLFVSVDLAAGLWPLRVGDEGWRFGAVGFVSNSLIMPTLGLALVLLSATGAGHRVVQRLCGAVAVVGALGLMAAGGLFLLDFFQLRSQVQPDGSNTLMMAGLRVFLKLPIGTVVLLMIALGAWKAARETRSRRAPERSAKAGDPRKVLVGSHEAGSEGARTPSSVAE